MAYDKTSWQNGSGGGTAVNSSLLNKLEEGVDEAHQIAETARALSQSFLGAAGLPVDLSDLAANDAFSGTYAAGYSTTATGDGVTDVAATLAAEITAAESSGRRLTLLDRSYWLGSQLLINGNQTIHIVGGNAVLERDHSSNTIRIEPVAEAGGTCAEASAGDTEIVVTGAGWDVDEHAGKWLALPLGTYAAYSAVTTYEEDEIVTYLGAKWQSTIDDNLNNTPALDSDYWRQLSGAMKTRVVSNTTDTLTLEYALGNGVPALDIQLFTPIERVEIDDLTVQGDGAGLANVVIQYVKNVRLRRVFSRGCNGNAITINFCGATNPDEGSVLIEDCGAEDSKFGMFVYNCDHVYVVRPKIRNWSSTYGVQLKDCRNGWIIDGIADGAGVDKNAFDIKCSGLNPARNLTISGGTVFNTTSSAFKMHALANEGTEYVGENFSILNGSAHGCSSGWQVSAASGGVLDQWQVRNMQAFDCTLSAFSIQANDGEATGIQANRSGSRAGTVTSSARVKLQAKIRNPSLTAGTDAAVRLDSVTDSDIDIDLTKSDADCDTTRAVQELNASDRNLIRTRIRQTAGTALVTDVSLLGASSRAVREPFVNVIDAATAPISVEPPTTHPLTADLAKTDSTLANLAGCSRALDKGRYRVRLVCIVDGLEGAAGGDAKIALVFSGTATGHYGFTYGANTSATAGNNQSARFSSTSTIGTGVNAGTIGAGTKFVTVVEGLITVTAAGTLQAQGAQTTTDATATTFHDDGTFLQVEKVG